MSDDMLDQRGFVDVWSRLLSIGSLILAGVTLYVYYLNSKDQPRANDIDSKVSAAVASSTKELLATQNRLDEDFKKLSATIGQDMLDLGDRVAELVTTTKEQGNALARLGSGATGSSPSDESDPNRLGLSVPPPIPDGTSSGVLEDGPASTLDAQQAKKTANLVAEYTAKRPADAWDRPAISIRNTGDIAAKIAMIEFIPQKVQESVPPEVYRAGALKSQVSKDRSSIRFSQLDNTSTKRSDKGEAYHGKYEHHIFGLVTIEPGETKQFLLSIDDDDFLSYAFEGKLILHFNGQEKVEFENVVIPFVDAT